MAWGPRYLASIMGICVLTLVPVLKRTRARKVMISLIPASVGIQVASIVYNFGLEFFQDGRHGTIPDGYVWRPSEFQLFCRFRNLGLHLIGRPDYDCIPPERERPETYQVTVAPESVRRIHAVNLFPFKARAITGNTTLFLGLLAVWLVGLVKLVLVVLFWRRHVRRGRPPTP